MREIGRVEAGRRNRSYVSILSDRKEIVLNIADVLESREKRYKFMRESVARLVRAGATKVTMRCNPDFDKDDWAAENCFIFTGYVRERRNK